MRNPLNNNEEQNRGFNPSFNPTEQQFGKIISEVEDYAIMLLDRSGKVVSWNKGSEMILCYHTKEIIGKSFEVFYPAEDVKNRLPHAWLEQASEKGKASHDGWCLRKDGQRFWGSVAITAVRDKDRVTGFLNITRDFTDKKTAEDHYNNLLEELTLQNEELKVEEERYQKMVSEVKDYAIILLDVDGKVLDWNKGAENVKGYNRAEIIGKNFRLFYPQEDKDQRLPQRLLAEAAKNGSSHNEGYRIRKDGSRFWAGVVITALFDDQKRLIGYAKVTKDLTERKAAEERLAIFTQQVQEANENLRLSEERYQKMVAEIQDYAIFMLNQNGEIQNWNAGAQLIKGYEAHEVIGRSFHLFYQDNDIAEGLPDRLLHEARQHGRASNEGWRKRKDGSRFWASVVITALHNRDGNVIGFSKVTRDLTDKKAAEDAEKENTRQLQIKNQELERLNAELSSFAYVVSHDFKEPIRKIQVFSNRQKENDKSIEQIREYSDKIFVSAQRMQKLMESLLYYSRISKEEAEFETVELNDVLFAVKQDLELLISEKRAAIISASLPAVRGIPFQLHQLFLNLVSNAIKFSHPQRDPTLEITASVSWQSELPEPLLARPGAYVCLTFTDNGIGFTTEQSAKIFDVFKRLRSKQSHGTGIGLAIVKKVTLNHNGYVTAQGEPNAGAKFRVYLPVDTESRT
jgi:PAS domain S-box-containing protein